MKGQNNMAVKTKTAVKETALVRKAPEEMDAYEKELYEDAVKAAGQEAGTGGACRFSIRGGVLTYNGDQIPGNEMAVCILDFVTLKTFYKSAFDADVVTSPDCYSFSRENEEEKPHEAVKNPCAPTCAVCPNNIFGTSKSGSGRAKACPDRRLLAVISVGNLVGGKLQPKMDLDSLRKTEIAVFTVPPTSVQRKGDGYGTSWKGYVQAIKATYQRAPYAMLTLVSVKPDPKNQVRVEFTAIDPADKTDRAIMSVIRERRAEAAPMLITPFPAIEAKEAAPAQPAGKAPRNKFSK